MNLRFDLQKVKVTEFGVGRDEGNGQTFALVPVDADVQAALGEMVQTTWNAMRKDDGAPAQYVPSEKHAGTEYLYLPVGNDLAAAVVVLHEADNLMIDAGALDELAEVFCYFARLTDKNGRRLTALRRATQFKGVVKSRLIRLVTDSLKLIEDRVFKLDTDFDLLIDTANVHILGPSGFEFAGKLQQAILAAVPENIKVIRKDLASVEFDGIEEYAGGHPRAARYLASIRAQAQSKNVDRAALRKLCRSTGVELTERKGKLTVASGHEMGFLEVLDRRRYELTLVTDQPERFRAGSRRKLDR